jgi:hypothetical protein
LVLNDELALAAFNDDLSALAARLTWPTLTKMKERVCRVFPNPQQNVNGPNVKKMLKFISSLLFSFLKIFMLMKNLVVSNFLMGKLLNFHHNLSLVLLKHYLYHPILMKLK